MKYSLKDLLTTFIAISISLGIVVWAYKAYNHAYYPQVENGILLYPYTDRPTCPICGRSDLTYSKYTGIQIIKLLKNPTRIQIGCATCKSTWNMRPKLEVDETGVTEKPTTEAQDDPLKEYQHKNDDPFPER